MSHGDLLASVKQSKMADDISNIHDSQKLYQRREINNSLHNTARHYIVCKINIDMYSNHMYDTNLNMLKTC